MSDAKIQHYTPQSYLRNFAAERNRQWYVHVRHGDDKFYETNIKNICSEQHFYSIPGVPDHQKNFVEKYYADNIDNLFPEITSVITDDSVTTIDLSIREKIIDAVLSLYFRTPKFLE